MYRVIAQNQTQLPSILEHLWHNGPETPVVTAFPDLSKVIPSVINACFLELMRPRKDLLRSKTSPLKLPPHTHHVPKIPVHRPLPSFNAHTYMHALDKEKAQ